MTFGVPSDFTLLKSRLTSVQRSRSKRQTGKETSQTYGALQRSPSPVCQAGRKVGGVNGEGSFWPNLIFFLIASSSSSAEGWRVWHPSRTLPGDHKAGKVFALAGERESHKQVGSRWWVERNNARSTRGKGCYSRVTKGSYSTPSRMLVLFLTILLSGSQRKEFLQRRAATTWNYLVDKL